MRLPIVPGAKTACGVKLLAWLPLNGTEVTLFPPNIWLLVTVVDGAVRAGSSGVCLCPTFPPLMDDVSTWVTSSGLFTPGLILPASLKLLLCGDCPPPVSLFKSDVCPSLLCISTTAGLDVGPCWF